MRKWIGLVVLLAILTGIDIGARTVAEEQVEVRAKESAPPGTEVSAKIKSFPFLGRLAVLGTINQAIIEFRNVTAPGIVFSRVELDLRRVEFDRGRLLTAQEADIKDIGTGRVTIEVSQEALSEKLGVPVRIAAGEVRVTTAGQEITARLSVDDDGVLTVDAGPLSRRLAIPETNYAPCVGRITLLVGRIRFTCTIRDVPPALLGAANRAS